MSRRRLAYLAYGVGSVIFLVIAVRRGSPLLATGSVLFLLGTVLFLGPDIWRSLRGRSRRSDDGGPSLRQAPSEGGATSASCRSGRRP